MNARHRDPEAARRMGAAAVALSLFLAGPAAAQEGEVPRPTYQPRGGPQDEMRELFADIERTLREIDELLVDAGAGETPLGTPTDSGIAKLLEETRDKGDEVVAGIDRLLELAEQNGGNCPSGQCEEGEPGGQKPQDGQSSPIDQQERQPGDREQTPEMREGGKKPEPQPGDEPRDRPENGEPESPRDSREFGANRPDDDPEATPPGDPSRAAGNDAWGDLPPRAREVFRNKGTDDLPAEYRDWIDAYYRRLNAR